MTTTEAIVVGIAVVAATVASILGGLTPSLAGLLGVAIGYGGKGAVSAAVTRSEKG